MDFVPDDAGADAISALVGATGATRDQAAHLLAAAGQDLQQAAELFFSGGAEAPGGGQGRPAADSNRGNYLPPPPPQRNAASVYDAYDGAGAGAGAGAYGAEDFVRAPDRTTRQTLIGGAGSIVPLAASSFSGHRTINAPFAGVASHTADTHDKKLAKIFRPPFGLLFKGSLEEAKASCREEKKWILVNIQDETDFQCLVLNRDVWSDDFIEAVVQCSFVLLQWSVDSPAGRQYVQLYEPGRPLAFPYVAVLDPETGALVKTITGPQTAEKLAEKFSDFLEKNPTSFTKPVAMRGVPGPAPAAVVSLVDSPERIKPPPGYGGSSSSSNSSSSSSTNVGNDSSISSTSGAVGSKRRALNEPSTGETAAAVESGLSIVDIRAGSGGSGAAADSGNGDSQSRKFKVSFRLPDNKRIAMEFNSGTTIYEIFSYLVKEKLPPDAGGYLDLFVDFPPRSVLGGVDTGGAREGRQELMAGLLQSVLAEPCMAGQMVTVKLTPAQG
jgi:hypothetical protein